MIDELKDILETLNHVSVEGEKNLYYLLGAVQSLKGIIEKGEQENV